MQPLDPILADGFRARNRRLYQLDTPLASASDYVSDAMREDSKKINRGVQWIANDKSLLPEMLGKYGAHAVMTFGMIHKGDYVPIEAEWREIRDHLFHGGRIVAKPRFGADGFGIKIFDNVDDLPTLMSLEEHVFTAFVRQARYAENVWSQSTNTVRILTMHLPDGPNFIAAAIHRFGTSRSLSTDNWEQGGMSASIDSRGRLGMGAITFGNGPIWSKYHPDTGYRFHYTTIPGWGDLTRLVIDMADEVDSLAHIGWDFVITEDGPVVLEMNANCGVCAIQVHGGLLRDPRVRAFYTAHEVTCPPTSTTTS